MSEARELRRLTGLLITPLGSARYRLVFQNERQYVAVVATGSQLARWTREIRETITPDPPDG